MLGLHFLEKLVWFVKKQVKITISLTNQISLTSQKKSNMKKISVLMLMVFSTTIVFSQSLDDINDMMGKKDYAAAKTAIDKYLSDAKNANKADGWYFKGRVYNSLSYEKTTPQSDLYNLKNSAYEAFKKYQQLEPGDIRMKLENYGSYLDLYFGLYDLGANLYNAKQYSPAYDAFKKAIEVEEYIQSKKYTYTQATLATLDTALILNIAVSATQAKKEDEAIPYYKRITDANIGGEGYKDVYLVLIEYYNKKGDAASANAILAKGKKNYPNDDSWIQLELDNIAKTDDQAALFAKYDEIIAQNPSNFLQAYNYSIVLYKSIYDKDGKQKDNMALKDKLTNVLKSAIAIDPAIDATNLMANHLYNMAADYESAEFAIKGTKPDDVKKKSELKALKIKKADECITYSENGVKYFESKSDLKAGQTANYKILLGYLSDMYSLKGDKKKADEYTKKQAAIK